MRATVLLLSTSAQGDLELGIDERGRWSPPVSGAERIELRHLAAFPGLVDAHAHLVASTIDEMRAPGPDVLGTVSHHAAAQLRGGVTLIADKGTYAAHTVDVVLDLPEEERPELQIAGELLASPGGYYPGVATEVDGAELSTAVAGYGPERVSWVKVIGDWPRRRLGAVPNFTEDELAAAVDAAHRQGRRVAVHTAAPEAASMAVRAGVDSIEHGLFLTEEDIAMLGERGGAWVPTVRAMETLAESLAAESSGRRVITEGLANVGRLLPLAGDAGVVVMCGTDVTVAHGAVVEEAAALVEYGLDEKAAVEALTTGPRSYLGSVPFEPTGCADVVCVDPPGGLAELRSPRLVIRCGRVIVDRRE